MRYRCCFFFSSRRRHTRCSRDWSSDVCSSDLAAQTRRCGAPVSRATAGVVLLILAARAAPAQGITVTVGPQFALASYREVASGRSEEHTSELQSRLHLVCRLLLETNIRYDPRVAC